MGVKLGTTTLKILGMSNKAKAICLKRLGDIKLGKKISQAVKLSIIAPQFLDLH